MANKVERYMGQDGLGTDETLGEFYLVEQGGEHRFVKRVWQTERTVNLEKMKLQLSNRLRIMQKQGAHKDDWSRMHNEFCAYVAMLDIAEPGRVVRHKCKRVRGWGDGTCVTLTKGEVLILNGLYEAKGFVDRWKIIEVCDE